MRPGNNALTEPNGEFMPPMPRIVPLSLTIAVMIGWFWFQTSPPSTEAAPGGREPIAEAAPRDKLDGPFRSRVLPFVEAHCVACHGAKKQSASLDLSRDRSVAAVVKNLGHWELALDRLAADEMPPADAVRPNEEDRKAVVEWLRALRAREAEKNAGDPGPVLARRLSNAAYDNTIRDLTGVDIRPTREFPVDPANQAGFDNSGESLVMSPGLLKKYLAAARQVADHLVLKPEGFAFAPHPVVADTDRDKYCVQRILDFYKRHTVDLADYFLAAWKHRHRVALGRPDAKLEGFATEAGLSAKYLATVVAALGEATAGTGPMAEVQKAWNGLAALSTPTDTGRPGCERLRDLVMSLRKPLRTSPPKVQVAGISDGSQAFILYRNRYLAEHRRSYTGPMVEDAKLRADLERFCSAFPDAFFVSDRSSGSGTSENGQGRPLTAGFHLMQGYFRDDSPLAELVLTDRERGELDRLWAELDFITRVPMRQYADFIFFERAEPPQFARGPEFDFARSEDKDAGSEAKMSRLAKAYVAKARKNKASDEAIQAIEAYFVGMSAEIRRVEKARTAAEPSHLQALVMLAERAYRRPLTAAERDDLLAFHKSLRDKDELGHEEAMRDSIATILMSPHACYRFDLAAPGTEARPLTDIELASRLSYFLWSSMPDAELMACAAAGDLHKPDVLKTQTRRMLLDPKVRGLATEFAGNWLDIRRFEEHNAVDRERFPTFTNELRQAMFEEPIRYFLDVVARNRSVLDLIRGTDAFVNRPLAKHYGMPEPPPGEWVRVEHAEKYGRGGLLPMAVFQTKNSPGLRTSPVKRGYWVVRSLLGERIPPPPPTVGDLPKDESKLGEKTLPQLLAQHRADKSCAGCHNRFDSIGLAFEGFGPVGERRTKDLGGNAIQNVAAYPDGQERTGLDGLRDYINVKRQDDFVDNLCRKLFAYALVRSLQLSDTKRIEELKAELKRDRFAFVSLVEGIVTSPQFLNKRGKDKAGE